ncbi:MAG: DMT family transporter [Beijerinckiaceae bacterium]
MPVTPLTHSPSTLDNRRGILSMLAASIAFVSGDTLVRLTAATMGVGQIMFMRGLMSVSIVLAIMAATGMLREMRALAHRMVIGRSLIEVVSTTVFIMALPHLPLADVTSILSSAPLIMTAMIVMLGWQTVGWRRWAAILVGFLGVVLVVQPTGAGIGWPALLLILCATLVAARDLFSQRTPPGIPTLVLTLGTLSFVTAFGGLLSLFQPWRTPSTQEMVWLASAACCIVVGNFFIVRAFRASDPTVVTPFRYVSILVSAMVGFLVWGDIPNTLAAIGALLIIGSGVYTIWRERVRAREAAAQKAHG